MSEKQEPKEKKDMNEPQPTSFRIAPRDRELIRLLGKKWDRSSSSVIRKLIREAAEREKIRLEEQ